MSLVNQGMSRTPTALREISGSLNTHTAVTATIGYQKRDKRENWYKVQAPFHDLDEMPLVY